MTDKQEALKKIIAEFKEKVSKQTAASKEPKNDPELRELRKQLKRAQRRLAKITKYSLEESVKRTQKRSDIISKLLSDMTKGAKKVQADPYVHSLRKKSKSLNKRLKKLNRLIEKQKKAAPPAPQTS
ncbi:MAG: hypothetical protein HYY16_05410 [Planctomycetes bacterium]|nr:hypothetical protein [Planctomycetota bacterium]